ncbi:hypothetical protein BOTBODRAFT_179014 [Botryobasidium botryosum FD-172 SS1]|uniref:SAM domain-containing protein n=1 Tax=Botryobasidium botryosum (strain FD-172 SS1) TaxID=930990 RepID=A0A067M432_BOTB1|nr:hypothetical protein BOTBODRAFT_179014 [Botryobasidium botryosum FD-172 SS1]
MAAAAFSAAISPFKPPDPDIAPPARFAMALPRVGYDLYFFSPLKAVPHAQLPPFNATALNLTLADGASGHSDAVDDSNNNENSLLFTPASSANKDAAPALDRTDNTASNTASAATDLAAPATVMDLAAPTPVPAPAVVDPCIADRVWHYAPSVTNVNTAHRNFLSSPVFAPSCERALSPEERVWWQLNLVKLHPKPAPVPASTPAPVPALTEEEELFWYLATHGHGSELARACPAPTVVKKSPDAPLSANAIIAISLCAVWLGPIAIGLVYNAVKLVVGNAASLIIVLLLPVATRVHRLPRAARGCIAIDFGVLPDIDDIDNDDESDSDFVHSDDKDEHQEQACHQQQEHQDTETELDHGSPQSNSQQSVERPREVSRASAHAAPASSSLDLLPLEQALMASENPAHATDINVDTVTKTARAATTSSISIDGLVFALAIHVPLPGSPVLAPALAPDSPVPDLVFDSVAPVLATPVPVVPVTLDSAIDPVALAPAPRYAECGTQADPPIDNTEITIAATAATPSVSTDSLVLALAIHVPLPGSPVLGPHPRFWITLASAASEIDPPPRPVYAECGVPLPESVVVDPLVLDSVVSPAALAPAPCYTECGTQVGSALIDFAALTRIFQELRSGKMLSREQRHALLAHLPDSALEDIQAFFCLDVVGMKNFYRWFTDITHWRDLIVLTDQELYDRGMISHGPRGRLLTAFYILREARGIDHPIERPAVQDPALNTSPLPIDYAALRESLLYPPPAVAPLRSAGAWRAEQSSVTVQAGEEQGEDTAAVPARMSQRAAGKRRAVEIPAELTEPTTAVDDAASPSSAMPTDAVMVSPPAGPSPSAATCDYSAEESPGSSQERQEQGSSTTDAPSAELAPIKKKKRSRPQSRQKRLAAELAAQSAAAAATIVEDEAEVSAMAAEPVPSSSSSTPGASGSAQSSTESATAEGQGAVGDRVPRSRRAELDVHWTRRVAKAAAGAN